MCSKNNFLVQNSLNAGDGMFQPKDEDDIHIFASGFAKATQENERVIQAARMLKPKNPSFMVLMRPYNICYNCVVSLYIEYYHEIYTVSLKFSILLVLCSMCQLDLLEGT